jgi:TRAP-type C4-dicarboxylate transport system permease small subunit
MRKLVKILEWTENALLVALLGAMVIFASSQILLRNLFDFGLVWIDPVLRAMLLWVGMFGASIASRNNEHIKIDLFSGYLDARSNLAIQACVNLFTCLVCLLVAWHGLRWILLEYSEATIDIARIPTWQVGAIIPLTFTLISLRYGLGWLAILRYFFRRAGLRRRLRG